MVDAKPDGGGMGWVADAYSSSSNVLAGRHHGAYDLDTLSRAVHAAGARAKLTAR